MEEIEHDLYKNLLSSSDKFSATKLQLVLFTVTTFGIVLGFMDKIKPDYLVLFIFYMILYVTTTLHAHLTLNQSGNSAYIAMEYYSKAPTIYLHKFYFKERVPNVKSRYKKVLIFFKNPFIIFSSIPFILTILHIVENGICQEILFYIVLAGIVLFQILIVLRVLATINKDVNYYLEKMEEFKKETVPN